MSLTLPEQSAILLAAMQEGLVHSYDVVRWADEVIVGMEKPPGWIIELSILPSSHPADFGMQLRQHATTFLPLHRQIQILVLAYCSGLLPLNETLSKIYSATILEDELPPRNELDKRLVDALIEWDCQDDLSAIHKHLQIRFDSLFREYLADISDVRAVLQWEPKSRF